MSAAHSIFTDQGKFDPAESLDPFLSSVPARWCVYLMSDARDQPIQLLCVRNLRASLKRRLGLGEDAGPTRKINYRELVRHVRWRRVDSAFEADWLYYELSQEFFPDTYGAMSGFGEAWWVHVNPEAEYPRYTRTRDPTNRAGRYFGPVENKHSASRLIQTVEGLFDLCRDYRILTQSPHGGPCAWKQMNKCAGPCDGTISLEVYRRLVEHSADVLSDTRAAVEQETRRMKAAAGEMAFEAAGRIKEFVEELATLTKGPYRHLRPIEKFAYLSLQHGPRKGQARVFLIRPGEVRDLVGLIDAPVQASALLRHVLHCAASPGAAIDESAAERLGVVAHHLFSTKRRGVFIPIDEADDKSLLRAYRELMKQEESTEADGEDEGVTRELQSPG